MPAACFPVLALIARNYLDGERRLEKHRKLDGIEMIFNREFSKSYEFISGFVIRFLHFALSPQKCTVDDLKTRFRLKYVMCRQLHLTRSCGS